MKSCHNEEVGDEPRFLNHREFQLQAVNNHLDGVGHSGIVQPWTDGVPLGRRVGGAFRVRQAGTLPSVVGGQPVRLVNAGDDKILALSPGVDGIAAE
jgi:hypothetical protein